MIQHVPGFGPLDDGELASLRGELVEMGREARARGSDDLFFRVHIGRIDLRRRELRERARSEEARRNQGELL